MRKKILIIALIIALFVGVLLQYGSKETVGTVPSSNRAIQQSAWTTFELYSNYTGGTKLTTNGIATITTTNANITNFTAFISPVDHKNVVDSEVYILKYIRFFTNSSTVTLNYTLGQSIDNGTTFYNITTGQVTGNLGTLDATLTAGKSPLPFSSNNVLRLDMQVNQNVSVKIEAFGSN